MCQFIKKQLMTPGSQNAIVRQRNALPMRILVTGINYWPELVGIGKYTYGLTRMLASQGHSLAVITTYPYFPSGHKYSNLIHDNSHLHDICIIRCISLGSHLSHGLDRIVRYITFGISSLLQIFYQFTRRKPELILIVVPSIASLFAATIGISILRVVSPTTKVWVHYQDLEIEAARSLNLIRSRFLIRALLQAESACLAKADMISSISRAMLSQLQKKVQNSSVVFTTIPNWVDTQEIRPLPGKAIEKNKYREICKIDKDDVLLLYSGSLGQKQDIISYVTAMTNIRDPNIKLLLACEGSGLSRIKDLIENKENITLIPLQPEESLNELLNAADIHILPQLSSAVDLVMPSKLAVMMASGRPIIATSTKESEVANIVAECGVVVQPGDINAIQDAILSLSGSCELRSRIGVMSRQLSMDFDVRVVEEIVCSCIQKIRAK